MASASVLSMVQDAAYELGTTAPTELVSSTDGDSRQWLRLVKATGKDLEMRGSWNILRKQFRFTGADLTLDTTQTPNRQYIALPSGFARFGGASSLWDDTLDVQANGPLLSEAWLAVMARETTSSRPYWSLIEDRINIYPVQGDTRKFIYVQQSDSWVLDAGSPQSSIGNDADTTIYDDELFITGLIWRWRKAKGLSYAEEMNTHEIMLQRLSGADRGERTVRTSALYEDIPDNYWPGIIDVPT